MRAAVLERADGRTDSVFLRDLPAPRPRRNEVLVRMLASPVNPSDLNYVDGAYARYLEDASWNRIGNPLAFDPSGKRPHPEVPFVLGGEGVGVVVETGGSLLARRLLGKRVSLTGSPTGLWQELAVVDGKRAVPVADSVPLGDAATMFVNPLTALALVEHRLRPGKGDVVLVTAAGGALAAMVRELCSRRGARTVDVVRSEEGRARLSARGVAKVLTPADDVVGEVARLTHGAGAVGVIDCVGGETAALAMRCLGRHGRMVVYGTLGREPMPLESRALMMRAASIEGFFLPHFLDTLNPLALLVLVQKARSLVESGRFRTAIRATHPLADVVAALDEARRGGDGKVLLRIGE